MNQQPQPFVLSDELEAAWRKLSDFRLHFYQLLYFDRSVIAAGLTTPGHPGSPFDVEFANNNGMIPTLRIKLTGGWVYKDSDIEGLQFPIRYSQFKTKEDQDRVDAEVIQKCKLIHETAREGKKKIDRQACCILAELRGCVCYISFSCPLHGTKCVGSHD